MEQILECQNCYQGHMLEPPDHHPSYLQCDACGAIELTYEPMDYQEKIHTVPYAENQGTIRPQIIAVFGGYGSGKSRSSVQEFFLRCLENPNGVGLITAPTLQLLKRTTIKTLLDEVIPPPLIENYNRTDSEITLANGFVIYAIPCDEEQKLRSINAGLVHMEEASAIKRSIYDQLLTRMRHPNVKNKAIFVCSNPELGWIKDVLVDNAKRKDPKHPEHEDYSPFISCFIWPTKLNKHLPPDFIEVNSKGKPSWWRRKYFEGSFESAEGAVYPNFAKCVIEPLPVIEEGKEKTDRFGIPLSWERVLGMDVGLRNPTAVVFGAIDPNKGEVIIYNEYYKANTLVPEHAKKLKPLIDEIPAGRIRCMKVDPAARNKTDPVNGKSIQGLFAEYGMFFTPGNNAIEAGILRVNSYIERGRLKIFNTCLNTIREHLNYKFPEISMDDTKNPDEKPLKKDEHSCFVAGTLIATVNGDVPIEKIKVGNEVLTRQGYKAVRACGMTDKSATVFRVNFSNGSYLIGTHDHPIWVKEKGFISIDSLRYGDIILPREELLCASKPLNGMGGFGEDTQIQYEPVTECITKIKKNISTERYGNTTTGKSLKGIIYTMLTEMHSIIQSKIYNRFIPMNTLNIMQKLMAIMKLISDVLKHTLKKLNNTLSVGINLKKVVRGIGNMLKKCIKTYKKKNLFVNNATYLFGKNQLDQISSVLTTVNLRGEETKGMTMKLGYAKNAVQNLQSINTLIKKLVQNLAEYPCGHLVYENASIAEMNLKPVNQCKNVVLKNVQRNSIEQVVQTTKSGYALFVEKCIEQEKTQNQKHVQEVVVTSIVPLNKEESVYGLSVQDCHEYVANGVLVKNCDANRYMLMALPDDPDLLKSIAYEPKMVYNRNDRVENEWHWGREWEDDERYQGDWMGY